MKQNYKIIMLTAVLLLASWAFAGPVSHFGALKVCNVSGKGQLCGSNTGTTSTPVLLKGPSLYWSDGSGGPFYNVETVDWFVDNMQIGVIRAAMGIRYYGNNSETVNKAGGIAGYYFDPVKQEGLIRAVINAAILNDIYVIVDWHSHNAHDETNLAVEFFRKMANEFRDVPNIIWEVYNEPVDASNQQVNSHANSIITALRNAGNNNLVLIGSPFYSQRPNSQASSYGAASKALNDNVAFTFHFYAASHPFSGEIGNNTSSAMNAGYAVFGSEWGTVNANGGGSVNSGASDTWTNFMDGANIGNCMWNASSLDEGSSIFTPNTGIGNLSTDRLTASGQYFRTYMGKNKWTAKIPSTHPKANDVTFSVNDGETATFNATQLGLTGTITEVKSRESFSVEVSHTANSITYKADGSKKGKIGLIYKTTQNNVTIQNKITVNITKRLPFVPEKEPIIVSRKVKTTLHIFDNLSAEDPTGEGGLELVSASINPSSAGTISTSGKNITFTPSSTQYNTESDATLNYTVKNKNGNRTASVILQIRNLAPTIRPITSAFSPEVSNTAPINDLLERFQGKDPDGDDIWFHTVYLDPKYPGALEKASDGSYVYTPDASKTGTVTFLAVITDGTSFSPVGRANIKFTGSGSDIGTITPPTEIPGYDGTPIYKPVHSNAKGISLTSLGLGKVELYFAQGASAKLDVYSLSGKNMGSLLNGWQDAGSSIVSLKSLNLQKGVYILRLKHGQQIKTIRIAI